MYTFVESVEASGPGYIVRLIGGLCWVTGMLIMAFNVFMTVRRGEGARQPIPQTA
jgi:cytochrome c oxidase cbb3-type subunit 1